MRREGREGGTQLAHPIIEVLANPSIASTFVFLEKCWIGQLEEIRISICHRKIPFSSLLWRQVSDSITSA